MPGQNSDKKSSDQQKIINYFGTFEYDHDYDYKQLRYLDKRNIGPEQKHGTKDN